MKFLFFVLVALLSSSSGFAYDHPLAVAELVDIALSTNPETKKAWSNAKIAAANVGVSESDYYPTLDLDLTAKKGKEFKYLNGPDTKFTEVGADLTLAWLLFDFGERSATVASKKAALLAANWEADLTMQKVVLDVLESTYNYLHLQEAVKADELSVVDARYMVSYATEMQKAGLAPISDVYTSQATYSKLQIQLTKQKADCKIKKGALLRALGIAFDTEFEATFEVAPIDTLPQPKSQDLQKLIQHSKKAHAQILASHAKMQQATHDVDSTITSFLPKLSFTASSGLNHYQHDRTKSSNYQLMLDLRVPIFSGFDSLYKTRVAKAQLHTSMAELAILELNLAQEVLSSSYSYEAAEESLRHANDYLRNSNLAYQSTLERYRAGKKNEIYEVSNALQQLSQARIVLSSVKTEWLVSLARLAYASATLSPKELP